MLWVVASTWRDLVRGPSLPLRCLGTCFQNGITPLMSAAEGGHLECVKVLLGRRRLRINARENFQAATALFIAARQGQANVVRLIANAGADIDLPESVRTALAQ